MIRKDAWSCATRGSVCCRNNPLFADRSYMVFCGWNDGLDAFESRVAGLTQMLGNVVLTGPQFGADKLDAFEAA